MSGRTCLLLTSLKVRTTVHFYHAHPQALLPFELLKTDFLFVLPYLILFASGKRVVLFALPGAFTPTCSSFQLPGYEKHYDEIKACGVDEVYCLSVNDAFVMRQWGLHQGLAEETTDASNPLNPGNFKKVKLIPDGAALFTRGMGMSCTWVQNRGFGERTWRYACVLNDMKVEKIFVEAPFIQDSEADPYEVSDAENILKYLKAGH